MKKSVFRIILLLTFAAAVYAYAEGAEVYCKYKKIANGVFLEKGLFVTTDNILLYNNIYFKDGKDIVYDYQVVFVDRITKLVFIRFNSDAEILEIPSDNMFVDGEPIFTMENGRKKRIGLFTQKINGYGAFFTTENGLYEGTAIYDIEGHFAGILMGRLNDKLYLFLYADMLAFYKDNIDSIREMKRPKLGIMVTEMWEFPGIRIKESANKSLKKNDIIIKVDSFLINNVLDFNRALFYSSTKKKLRFTVLRGKEKKMITVYGG